MQPTASVAQIRAALDNLLSWPEISRSPQLAQFLRYIVEATLEGRDGAIKAYSIAVDVFGRPADFDPQADPIVRVQARRLRTLLEQYYDEGHNDQPVRIRLPVGRYIPEFELVGAVEPSAPPAAPALPAGVASLLHLPNYRFRSGLLIGAFFTTALAGLVYLAVSWGQPLPPGLDSPPPSEPKVTVVDFTNLAGEQVRTVPNALALELVTDLGRFDDIAAGYELSGTAQPPTAAAAAPGSYVLSGVMRVVNNAVEYGAILTSNSDQKVTWSYALSRPTAEASQPRSIDEVSRSMALVLGSPRGPLHQPARQWLAMHPNFAAAATPYICRVAFDLYRDTGRPSDARAAKTCFAALPADEQIAPASLATSATLSVDTSPPEKLSETMENADRLADAAVTAAPISSFVWEQVGHIDEMLGDLAKARSAYASAAQLNPASPNALAALGRLLALGPDWQQGEDLAMTAIEDTPDPPPWYFAAPALNALRSRNYEAAQKFGETLAQTDRTLGSVIVVTAGLEAGDTAAVSRFLPQVLDHQPFRARGIMPELSKRLTDGNLLASLGSGLERAGVPPGALTGGY